MKKVLLLSAVLVSMTAGAFVGTSIAAAQTPAPPADQELTVKVTRSGLQAIGIGLMKLPYETSAPILQSLQKQLDEIDKPKSAAPSEAKPAPDPAQKPKTNPPK